MRKLVIAKVKSEDLLTVGSAVESELYCLAYGDKVGYEKGYYWIQGRENIKRFVNSMQSKIDELKLHFKDEQSVLEFTQDENYLNNLLKIKAS